MAKGIKIRVTGLSSFDGVEKALHKSVCDSMDVIRMDLVRTSSGLTPFKTGALQDSHKEKVSNSKSKTSFKVTYAVFNSSGQNYAEIMHNTSYNLGPGSRAKRPARSRFSAESFKVGPGYLVSTANACKDGWKKFIEEQALKEVNTNVRKNSKK